MKHRLQWLFPREFLQNPAYFRALGLAFLYVGLLLAQLFTFEKFADVTYGFGLPGGMVTAGTLAVFIPLIELMALPFLISMKLDRRLRTLARACVVAVPGIWLILLVWQVAADSASKVNAGLFGATLTTPVGSWLIIFAALMLWAAILVVRELPKRRRTYTH